MTEDCNCFVLIVLFFLFKKMMKDEKTTQNNDGLFKLAAQDVVQPQPTPLQYTEPLPPM